MTCKPRWKRRTPASPTSPRGHSQERLRIFGAALRGAWGAHPAPACTLIPVPRLALDGILFEIEATAFTSTSA